MPRLVLLGTAAAVPDAEHENTYMVLDGAHGSILIDCAGGPIGRLERAGVPLTTLQSIIITHVHPDHAYGLPILLMSLWLLGRDRPLPIHAPVAAIPSLRMILDAYGLSAWPRFYPIEFSEIAAEEGVCVLENEDVLITATPCDHFVPTVSLKIATQITGRTAMYTSDTAPADSIRRLAQGVDLLLHEVAGATTGHSSAAMAGQTARQAKVGKLILIHYQVYADQAALVAEARAEFDGPIEIAQDFAEYLI